MSQRKMDICNQCHRYAIGCEPIRRPDGSRLRVLQRDATKRFCIHHNPETIANRIKVREANRKTCLSFQLRQKGNRCLQNGRRIRSGTDCSSMFFIPTFCWTEPYCEGLTIQTRVGPVKVTSLRALRSNAPKAATQGAGTLDASPNSRARCLTRRHFHESEAA